MPQHRACGVKRLRRATARPASRPAAVASHKVVPRTGRDRAMQTPMQPPTPNDDIPGSIPHPMHDPVPDQPVDPPVPTPGDPERDPQPQRDPPSPTRPQDPPQTP